MTISRSPLLKTTICIGFASLLAGCLSSGGSGGSSRDVVDQSVTNISSVASPALIDAVNNNPSLSVSEVQDWDSALNPIAETLFDDKPVSPWANTPTSGQRTYIGGIELVPDGNNADRVFGVMTAIANFNSSSNAIVGTGRDFVHIGNGTAQPGTLTLDAQFFPGNDLTEELGISGSLTGTLSGPDLAGDVDVDFAGDFADSGTVIYGGGTGDISGTDLTAAVVLSQN